MKKEKKGNGDDQLGRVSSREPGVIYLNQQPPACCAQSVKPTTLARAPLSLSLLSLLYLFSLSLILLSLLSLLSLPSSLPIQDPKGGEGRMHAFGGAWTGLDPSLMEISTSHAPPSSLLLVRLVLSLDQVFDVRRHML